MNVPLKRYFARLSEYLRPQSRRVLALAALLFASVGLQLLNPQILIRMRSIAVPYWTAMREASAHFFGFLGKRPAGTEDIRSSGATGYGMHQFYALLREWLPLQRRAATGRVTGAIGEIFRRDAPAVDRRF